MQTSSNSGGRGGFRREGNSTRGKFSGSRPGGSFSGTRSGSFSGGRSGGSRFSGSRGGFGGRGGRSAHRQTSMDVSKFVNKAKAAAPVAPAVITHQFADFEIQPQLKKAIITKGYVTPTPIQDRTIPEILKGHDMVGIANTGSGKTGAFLIPLINKVLLNPRERVLIMVPTRELATQIRDELRSLTTDLRIFSTVCVGGVGIIPQIRDLQRRPAFVIGTPGRLKDLLERRSLNLSEFGSVVLDEADRMLDMGFVHDMRQILSLLPANRHTLFFSATLSPEIQRLVGEFLQSPIHISVKTGDTSQDIEQDVVRIGPGQNKLDVLHDLLIQPGFDKVLVFGRTKHGVEKLAKLLVTRGFKAESIHGNKTQNNRQRALDLFKRDHVQVLVATDVAARGIDISDISHVINYDLPSSDEDYIHRIGRTGRAGKQGKALTFIE